MIYSGEKKKLFHSVIRDELFTQIILCPDFKRFKSRKNDKNFEVEVMKIFI